MCFEDVKIGRNSQSQMTTITAQGGGSKSMASPDNSRISMLISGDGVSTVKIHPGPPDAAPTWGYALTPQAPTIALTLDNVGSQLWQEWSAYTDGLNAVVTIITTSLPAKKASDLKEY